MRERERLSEYVDRHRERGENGRNSKVLISSQIHTRYEALLYFAVWRQGSVRDRRDKLRRWESMGRCDRRRKSKLDFEAISLETRTSRQLSLKLEGEEEVGSHKYLGGIESWYSEFNERRSANFEAQSKKSLQAFPTAPMILALDDLLLPSKLDEIERGHETIRCISKA